MRKYIILLLLVLLCSSSLCAEAATGNVEIQVPSEQNMDIIYTKIGRWNEGKLVLEKIFSDCGVDWNGLERNHGTKEIIQMLESVHTIPAGRISVKNGFAQIENLEEGLYLMQGICDEECQVQSALISVPAWDSAVDEMNYEVKWTPKINEVVKAAATGDASPLVFILIICVISLLFVARTLYFSLTLC